MPATRRAKGAQGVAPTPKTKRRAKSPSSKGKPARVPKPAIRVSAATTKSGQARQRVARSIVVNRQQAYQYASAVGNERVIKLLMAAMKDLDKRLKKVNPALVKEGAFTPTAMRASLRQIEDLVAQLVGPGVRAAATDSARIAAALGKVDGLKNLAAMDERFGGVASSGRLGVAMQLDPKVKKGLGDRMFAKQVSGTILRKLAKEYPKVKPGKGIIERYGMETISAFEEKMRVGMVTGKSWPEMREDLTSESSWLQGTPVSWAQRIVRTESMGAYNRSILESGKEANEVVGGDMVKVLLATFDDRTGWDSYQVHGQIRRLDEPFEWVTKNGDKLAYVNPPNRPNDREVIVFHRIAWPIPESLKPLSDAEYEGRFAEQNKSGSAPPRPKMTTVPLSKFGKE